MTNTSRCFLGVAALAFHVTLSCHTTCAAEPAAGKQVATEIDVRHEDAKSSLKYLIYLPHDYAADADKQWPVMLFLHGRGESYGPIDIVKKWGPPRMVERGEKLPYILISPQCPPRQFWSQPKAQAHVIQLLDHVLAKYKTDKQRIYLTGLSMGGYGSWRMAADYPQRFAAVAPICGGGKPEDGKKLKDIPIWVFHGDQDRVVPFKRSVEMVEAIRAAGGKQIRFTTLEGIGHNSWSAAYATPELYSWMNKQKLKPSTKAATEE